MTTNEWVSHGPDKWTWETWVGDTQVIYVLSWVDGEKWLIVRKVPNAAQPETFLGSTSNLDTAMALAGMEHDKDQQKGF